MDLFQIYRRALGMLGAERGLAVLLALASVAIGLVQLAEPIIAHRLSTVADADEILVFENGRIIERGRFEDLARGAGLFSRMVAEGGFTVPQEADS